MTGDGIRIPGICRHAGVLVEYRIAPVVTAMDLAAIGNLFTEYAHWLDREHSISLCFQNFDEELAGLPGKYAPPDGALFLARAANGAPIGCVALRPFDEGRCEIKRLYVAPQGRGLNLGRALVGHIMAEALRLGYRQALLDTASFMEAAQKLYAEAGFRDIPAYYDNPMEAVRFMARDL